MILCQKESMRFRLLWHGWALLLIPFRSILISPVTQIWLSVWGKCLVLNSLKISICPISLNQYVNFGGGGTSRYPPGFAIICTSRLVEVERVKRGLLSIIDCLLSHWTLARRKLELCHLGPVPWLLPALRTAVARSPISKSLASTIEHIHPSGCYNRMGVFQNWRVSSCIELFAKNGFCRRWARNQILPSWISWQ